MSDQGQNQGQNDQRPQFPRGGNNNFRFILLILGALVIIPLITNLIVGGQSGNQISYSRFRGLVEDGSISSIVVEGQEIRGTIRGGTTSGMPGSSGFVTYIPSFGDPSLLGLLEENEVQVETRPVQDFSVLGIILNILPLLIFVWIGITLFRSMRSQGRNIFSVGQNKAKLYEKKKEHTTFADVAGLHGTKEEVFEVIDYLRNPKRYQELGAKTPKGILLVGPPGTGKTLIARAIAGEADAPFYSMSGSDFMEMFVGVGASRVRKLFEDAKKNSPSIIFIDELDSIGRHRGAGLGGGHDEREQTLNQMLAEMDGFEPNETTIVLAATNRPDILDPALLRPGRFDRRITVGLPSQAERVDILKIHARKRPLDSSVDLEAVAQATPGFSGADLQNLLNEAAILAARQKQSTITQRDINEARDKVLMGVERKGLSVTADEKELIAYHEAGHAILAAVLPETDPLMKVTIIPRDYSMGVTQQLPKHEKFVYSKKYLDDRITVMLGGRAAEEIIYETGSSGAENDFKQATDLARRMVTAWGMSAKLGTVSTAGQTRNVFLGEQISNQREYSEATAREIDEEIHDILGNLYNRARTVLTEHRAALDKIAQALLEKEELDGPAVIKIIDESNAA
jgi:cell division protease FtsH